VRAVQKKQEVEHFGTTHIHSDRQLHAALLAEQKRISAESDPNHPLDTVSTKHDSRQQLQALKLQHGYPKPS
jgi:hypothetical protein